MATLGTFVAGQVLTAAELNAIADATAWTPTWSGSTGGTPTVITNRATYFVINDVAFAIVNAFRASAGTATGTLRLSLPTGLDVVANNRLVGSGKENLLTGDTLNLTNNTTTTADIFFYDGSSVLSTGGVFIFSMAWELA